MSTRSIKITKGLVALVDEADYEDLSQYNWHACSNGRVWFAKRRVIKGEAPEGSPYLKHVAMHRHILGIAWEGRHVQADHINHNMLDNRRANLRIASPVENNANRRPYGKSGVKGVVLLPSGRFKAYCRDEDSTQRHLGVFDTIEEASDVYDAALIKLRGKFALTNAALRAPYEHMLEAAE